MKKKFLNETLVKRSLAGRERQRGFKAISNSSKDKVKETTDKK